jgi:glycosyltransferase involved in cell wall biosynthesis
MEHERSRPIRVAFLTNIVSPYRRPVLEKLAAMPEWQLRVFVDARNERTRRWDGIGGAFDTVVSRGLSFVRRRVREHPVRFVESRPTHLPLSLPLDLVRYRPDVVFAHELNLRTMIAAAYCTVWRTPLVIWSYQSVSNQRTASRGSERIRRALLRRADVVVGMGRQARRVLRTRGVPDERIVDAPNAPDLETLLGRARSRRSRRLSDELRRGHAGGRRIAAVVGRLIPGKGIPETIAAWRRLPPSLRSEWRLVFVGEGPLEPLVRAAADDGVVHAGHVPPHEVADWYGAMDLHVFPTCNDVWGLVANEAMACGDPTICSRLAGCSDDLIEDGANGFLFDPTDPDTFDDALRRALSHPDLARLGTSAIAKGRRHSPATLAGRFADAIRRAALARTPSAFMARASASA